MYRLASVLDSQREQTLVSSPTATVSFRLDSALRDELAHEAGRKGLSLNAHVGECLRRCVDWVRLEQEFEHVSIPKEALVTILDKVPDNEIAALGRMLLASRMADFANLLHGTTDVNGLYSSMKLSAKYQYPTPVACEIRKDDKSTHIFLHHGISRKWSLFLAEGYMAYLQRIRLTGSYEATNKSLKITIHEP